MKLYSFYHLQTGAFHQNKFGTTDPTQLTNNIPAGHMPIERHFDHLSQRVDVERLAREDSDALTAWSQHKRGSAPGPVVATAAHVIDYRPPQPSADHQWNVAARRWQLVSAAADKIAASRSAAAEIARLEHDVQPQALREAALGYEGAIERLRELDAQITELRNKL